MIKAIIFDVDGTLIHSLDANLKFFQRLMRHFGYPQPTKKQYEKIHHLSMLDNIRVFTKSTSEELIRKIWHAGSTRKVAYPSHLVNFPKDLSNIITTLNKKYQLAIVTQKIHFRDRFQEYPELLSLKNYFKVVISYEDTNNHKPDPEPLLLAVKKLHIKPNEAIYVGDSESDIVAAKNAGMDFIGVVNKRTTEEKFNFHKVKSVKNFGELIRIL